MIRSESDDLGIKYYPTGRVALIDGDPLVYRAAWACQKTYYMVVSVKNKKVSEIEEISYKSDLIKKYPDIVEIDQSSFKRSVKISKKIVASVDDGKYFYRFEKLSPESYLKHTIKCMIKDIVAACKATTYSVYLTGKGNFREDEATIKQYKGNRLGKTKPEYYKLAREYLIETFDSVVVDGMEADDALAIDHWKGFYAANGIPEDCKTVLVTIDKDLRQVPGWNYDLNHYHPDINPEDREAVWIDELGEVEVKGKKAIISGLRGLYAQVLLGDVCDHIPGLKGYGPVKASKIVNECDNETQLYQAILKAYRHVHGDEVTYYPWTEYVDPNVPKKDLVLKPEAVPVTKPVEEVMHEIMGLLYMLKSADDKWTPPVNDRKEDMTDIPETTKKPANACLFSFKELEEILSYLENLPYNQVAKLMHMIMTVTKSRGYHVPEFEPNYKEVQESDSKDDKKAKTGKTSKSGKKGKKGKSTPAKRAKSKTSKVKSTFDNSVHSSFEDDDDAMGDEEE